MLTNEERGIIARYIERSRKVFHYTYHGNSNEKFDINRYMTRLHLITMVETLSIAFNREYDRNERNQIEEIFFNYKRDIDRDFQQIQINFDIFNEKIHDSAFEDGIEKERKEIIGIYSSIEDYIRSSGLNNALTEGIEHCHFHVPCSNCGKPMHFDEDDQNWEDEVFPIMQQAVMEEMDYGNVENCDVETEYDYNYESMPFYMLYDQNDLVFKIGVEHEHLHFQCPANGAMIHFDQSDDNWHIIKRAICKAFSSWHHTECPVNPWF